MSLLDAVHPHLSKPEARRLLKAHLDGVLGRFVHAEHKYYWAVVQDITKTEGLGMFAFDGLRLRFAPS